VPTLPRFPSLAAFERRPGGLVHVASSVMGPASETRHMNRHARAYPARQKPLIKLWPITAAAYGRHCFLLGRVPGW